MEQTARSPLTFSRKVLISMLIPVIMNDLLNQAVGIADSVMVSSVGEVAVSALSLSSSLHSVFSTLFFATAIGAGVVFAQYLGAQDLEAGRSAIRQSFWINLLLSLPAALILIPLSPMLMDLCFSDADPAVRESGILCLRMVFAGLPFIAVEQVCMHTFIAMGRNAHVLRLNLSKNLMNICGNALFIYGFQWGLFGALLSTLISHIVFCILAIWLLHNKDLPLHFEGLLRHRLHKQQAVLVLRIGAATAFQQTLFRIGKLLTSSAISTLPVADISANSIATSIVAVGWSMTSAFATVLGSVAGRCIGAEQPAQAKYYTKRMVVTGFGVSAALFGLIFLLRQPLVSIYALAAETKMLAAENLAVGCILTVFCGHAIVCILASAFQAAGDVRYNITTSVLSMFLCQIPATCLCIYGLHLGIASVWIGMAADWFTRTIIYVVHYRRGKWLTKKVI